MNWKLIILALLLIALGTISFFFKDHIKSNLEVIINNNVTDWVLGVVLVVILIFHRINNRDLPNTISDKEGLHNFYDYFMHGVKIWALLYAAKLLILLRFFPQNLDCEMLDGINLALFITLTIISYLTFDSFKDVASEAFRRKEKVGINSQGNSTN